MSDFYKIKTSCRSYAIGFAALIVVMLPIFIWVAMSLINAVPQYIEKHALDQIIFAVIVILLFIVRPIGGLYFFIPPIAEVEEFEFSDGRIRIKRAVLPTIHNSNCLSYRRYKILIPNYTEDKNRKNFEAYLYISWPVFFVVSERIEGYEEINKILQINGL